MNSNKIIYKIVVQDIQDVAQEEIDRKLTDDEINKIIDTIGERINWYDVVADSINEKINS